MHAEAQFEQHQAVTLIPEHLRLTLVVAGQAPDQVRPKQLLPSNKDRYTRLHCENLSRYGVAIGQSLQLAAVEIEALRIGGIIHDLGKTAIPAHILNKSGALTVEERLIVEAHPVLGEAMCAGIPSLQPALPIVRHHHERFDGSGYPDRLCGERIPLTARIVQIVDIFDAMTSARPYKAAWSAEHALTVMQGECECGWIDPRLFRQFVRLVRQPEAPAFVALR